MRQPSPPCSGRSQTAPQRPIVDLHGRFGQPVIHDTVEGMLKVTAVLEAVLETFVLKIPLLFTAPAVGTIMDGERQDLPPSQSRAPLLEHLLPVFQPAGLGAVADDSTVTSGLKTALILLLGPRVGVAIVAPSRHGQWYQHNYSETQHTKGLCSFNKTKITIF